MFRGPFSVQVSKHAEQVDISALPDTERQILTHGISFDPSKYDAYRFFIIPKIEILDETPDRYTKRVSFEQVNRVLVDVAAPDEMVQFLGMYPTTLKADGRWELDLKGEAIFNPVAPGVGSIKLSAIGKRLIRQKSHPWIKAHRTDGLAQWLYFEEWLRETADFRMEILCSVEKSTSDDKRHVLCNAKFADEGRSLAKVENQRVLFPIKG
ncbi:hypothetical protein [Nitrosomonas sp. Nm166]|uniref:hypothetical protein n=1 Tax=Nitrosomonas sp. Nm166 TaxID=1881054 RepID=UPI0008E0710E|nr:hypothetical protein [Nitrosomonas sp. Nm166]SFF08419.1 hypothetical protein SAMN05428977_10489 [Nitrosomonas sp. Nm166]